MPDLDFGDTPEETLMVLRTLMSRVHADLYNSGKDGLLTRFNKWTADHDAHEASRKEQEDRRHRENSERLAQIANQIADKTMTAAQHSTADARKTLVWTVAGVGVAIMALVFTILGVLIAARVSKTGSLPDVFHHSRAMELDTASGQLSTAPYAQR